LFSYQEGNDFDPFLLLDYAGPYQFAPAEAKRGVGEHPHRGFETVTIVYQGELEHRDSSGSRGSIGSGDVQWMTAASGVVHEEFHSERFAREGGILEMVQLWVNLPAEDKMSEPRYQGIVDAQIPRVSLADGAGSVRVIAGEFQGVRGPARTFSPIDVWDLQLNAQGQTSLNLAEGRTSLVVVQAGAVRIDDRPLKAVELALFDRRGGSVSVTAESAARVLVLSGRPLDEPVVQDYQAGRMGRLA
jgi:redox-sensitive bicupin YhaK (pirin superfamily)